MESELEIWTILTAFQRRFVIDPTPGYQRSAVWDKKKRQLLIDSILRGYDIPKFYLRRLKDNDRFEYEIVDGQQRLRAIWSFLADELEVGSAEGATDLSADLIGRTYSELPSDIRDRVGLFPLAVSILGPETPQEQVQELFLRLQEGVSLNAAEKRNAMRGPVRDFIAQLGEEHRLFPLLGISGKRYQWHELAAIALHLERSDGPAELKAAPLNEMYKDSSFDPRDTAALEFLANLDAMALIARVRPSSVKTRWGFVDLYLATRRLRQLNYEMREIAGDVLAHHLIFEDERLQAAGAFDEALEQTDENYELRDIDRYVIAFRREGATEENVAHRHEVYFARVTAYIQGRVTSDEPIDEL